MHHFSSGAAAARAAAFACALMGALAALGGCAASVPAQPAELATLATAVPDFEVPRDFEIRLSTGYTRVVPAGSRWRAVGRLPQGAVYRPLNTIFAIEGRNVHEAYLVVQDRAVQGFYLPGESRYSPLAAPIQLPQGAQP